MINVTVLSLLLRLNFPRGKMNCVFFPSTKQAKQRKTKTQKPHQKYPKK